MSAVVVDIVRGAQRGANGAKPVATLALAHDERHVRRRTLKLPDGSRILLDLPEPTVLQHGDRLTLDDGRYVLIEAAPEAIYELRARDPVHLLELVWHIGNRHLAAEVHADCIRILRDPVIRTMLVRLGAELKETMQPFVPLRGAYRSPDEATAHHHHHPHEHHRTMRADTA